METATETIPLQRHRQIEIAGLDVHVVESGLSSGRDFLLLHGWPEDWSVYESLLELLGDHTRAVAVDLPGIGRSKAQPESGRKRWLAQRVADLIRALGLRDVTLVGHDIGGQVAYACLRVCPELIGRAVLMNMVVPGIDPWAAVIRNPQLWHFAFNAVPMLPETLVVEHVAEYFAFFYDRLAGPRGMSSLERERYIAAYARRSALQAGFAWYRAFAQDENENKVDYGELVRTPVLCLRGDKESGAISDYVEGLRRAGCAQVDGAVIADCGHFAPSEQPELVAAELQAFASRFAAH